jgi:glyoxylase-like metal-dependent hydrolase (beta-lactamase superfamily II)
MFQSNCYIVSCSDTNEGVVIDAGDEGETILSAVDRSGVRITAILQTHAHLDHVGALDQVAPALAVPVCMHKDEVPVYERVEQQATMFGLGAPKRVPIDRMLEDGEKINIGNLTAKVVHAPGHSPGSVCFYFANETPPRIIVGDVLFKGSIGRTDLPGGDYGTIMNTLAEVFLPLSDDTIV